jgi:cytidylate kinase
MQWTSLFAGLVGHACSESVMLILLIGPKGSGKTHIGRVLERRLGVHFFHVEPHWMTYHEGCRRAAQEPEIQVGMQRVHPLIARALQRHAHVCVETTGASMEILVGLLTLAPSDSVLKVRVNAPLDLCLHRVATRDSAGQIPMDSGGIWRVHELSVSCDIESDLQVDNRALDDEAIVSAIAPWLAGAPSRPPLS